MKKLLLFLPLFLIFLSPVKADTTYYQLNMRNYTYNDFSQISYNNQDLRSYFLSIFNSQSDYSYYVISLNYDTFDPSSPEVYFSMFNNTDFGLYQSETAFSYTWYFDECSNCRLKYSNNSVEAISGNSQTFEIHTGYYYSLIDTNYNFLTPRYYSILGLTETPIDISNIIPSLYSINNPSNYTEINLDNYDYVLLSLKNYNQTQAFQTNFQVKGQIGITPIYNFGQSSKDSITGVQVQDRCNVSYSDFTAYPFYIIQSDLQNNAIFAVKECSSGSSFKFDNTIFDITYITDSNKDNPQVTIDGKTYNVIPYNDLPSTATKNETDNYIPGESGSANSSSGLDSAIKSVQQRMSEIWNTFTYFTDFINQIFSSLPQELQTILISAFTISIILGLIKIFVL